MHAINEVNLTGVITKIYPIFTTPGGVKVSRFFLEHKSEQLENGQKRRVNCKIFCVAIANEICESMSGYQVNVNGFLSVNAQNKLILNITNIQNWD